MTNSSKFKRSGVNNVRMPHDLNTAEQGNRLYWGEEAKTSTPKMMFVSELKSVHFWASALVELLATFFFIFLTTGTTITWNPSHPPSTELISLSFGFSIATLAMCSSHLSGGHINPAVTIAMMALRKVNILRGVTYIIFQLAGGEIVLKFQSGNVKKYRVAM